MRLGLLAFLLCTSALSTVAQEVRVCGLHEATEELFARFPHTMDDARAAEEELEEWTANRTGGDDEVRIIPIVFHIIHANGPENISDEQVHSAVQYLNEDMRKLNSDVSSVIPEFEDIVADCEIEFRIAQLDPQGNCTNGVTRTVSDLTYVGDSDMKQLIQWPRDSYLNVWVCAYAAGAAGYSLYPSSVNDNPGQDGIVLRHDYCGVIGTGSMNTRHTLAHEVGHWLNLRHTWGNSNDSALPSNCDSDDLVGDTPNTEGWTSCSPYGETCGSLDNVQNFMEYSGCRMMFTEGQKTRMRNALDSGVSDRNELWTDDNLIDCGVFGDENILCQADFEAERVAVCLGETVQFYDESFNEPSSWSWDFGDGTVVTGSDAEVHKDPIHTYEQAGNYTVTLTVASAGDELSIQKTGFISVLSAGELETPFIDGFEWSFPGDRWWVNNINDDLTWAQTNVASYSGDNCLRINNFVNDFAYNTDEVETSTFDFEGQDEIYISYKWAYANKTGESTSDRLRVYISPDCGVTWILKAQHNAQGDLPSVDATNSPFIPDSPSEWNSNVLIVNNPTQITSNFRVKFTFMGVGGNNIYLDNINIGEGTQVSVEELVAQPRLNVFPNPTSSDATVNVAGISGVWTLDMTDMTGRLIESRQLVLDGSDQNIQLDLNLVSNGSYLISVYNSVARESRRLVIAR